MWALQNYNNLVKCVYRQQTHLTRSRHLSLLSKAIGIIKKIEIIAIKFL